MIVAPPVPVPVAGLVLLVAEEPTAAVAPGAGSPASLSPGDFVASGRLTAGCPTGEVALAMNPAGLADSPAALARMVQARCKAIAPQTRLLVTAPVEKGAVRVQQANGVAEPLFVVASDFGVLPGRRP